MEAKQLAIDVRADELRLKADLQRRQLERQLEQEKREFECQVELHVLDAEDEADRYFG